MVDFRGKPKLRNYLSRREQWRMLLLVMSLGLAVVVMFEARKPENWRWIDALDDMSADMPAADTAQPAKSSQDGAGTLFDRKPDGGDPSARYFPGVKPELLKSIEDNTTFRPEEADAWFHLFAVLNNNDEPTLRKASTGRVTRAQLFEQSNEYRGELVTVVGTVRRAFRMTAHRNDYDVPGYYRVWLQPEDNRNDMIVVYCLYLPQDFPTGMKLDEDARIVGFYFKRWPYRAAQSIEIAPTLLARTIEWRKRPKIVKSAPRGPGSVVVVVVGALIFSLLVTMYVYLRTRNKKLIDAEVPADFQALAREDDRDANDDNEPAADREDTDKEDDDE